MSEHSEDQGKWVWAFILGVIVGALLMVGVGGGLWMMQARQARARAEEAAMEADRAREMEMMARERAEQARQAAEEARKQIEAEKAGKK